MTTNFDVNTSNNTNTSSCDVNTAYNVTNYDVNTSYNTNTNSCEVNTGYNVTSYDANTSYNASCIDETANQDYTHQREVRIALLFGKITFHNLLFELITYIICHSDIVFDNLI